MRTPTPRAAGRTAWSLCALCLVLNVLAFGFDLLRTDDAALDVAFAVMSQAFPVLGAVIASRRPTHPMGWLYLAAGLLLTVGNVVVAYARYAVHTRAGELPGGPAAAWVGALTIPVTFLAVALLFLRFPDGRLPSPRWRPFARAYVGITALDTVAVAVTPGELFGIEGIGNPWGVESGAVAQWAPAILGFVLLSTVLGLLVSVLSMLPRFRAGGVVERLQLKWMTYAAVLLGLAWLAAAMLVLLGNERDARWFVWLATLATAAVPVAGGVAILRYRLFDIDLLIRRSIVYGGLWLIIGAGYLGAVAGLGIAAGNVLPMQLAVAVAILATLLFQPLRRRLDRLAQRRVFGERLSGEQLLQRFGETLEYAYDLAELAPRIATAVRHGLDLRWARVLLRFEAGELPLLQRAGSSGVGADDQATPEMTVPLVHAGEAAGVLECGPKVEGSFTERDRELLVTLGRQAALAIRNARLAGELAARLDEIGHQAEELRASRARIVHAQDTERRRLERDLHDGIQQELVALKARLRLVRNELHRRPEEADASLAALQQEIGHIIDDLRELARGIHPAVLTDRGLVEAVEARAATLPLGVDIHADARTRTARFSEHIEATAYFIVSEALANVLKHARATAATVRIWSTSAGLHVEVSDDGVGFDPTEVARSGLTGLRDRVEAVGGRFTVVSQPGHGTRLVADLPAPERERSDA